MRSSQVVEERERPLDRRPGSPGWETGRLNDRIRPLGLIWPLRQLRHSQATALLRAGVHPKVVQERLGHASIAATTLGIYNSVLPIMQRTQSNA